MYTCIMLIIHVHEKVQRRKKCYAQTGEEKTAAEAEASPSVFAAEEEAGKMPEPALESHLRV